MKSIIEIGALKTSFYRTKVQSLSILVTKSPTSSGLPWYDSAFEKCHLLTWLWCKGKCWRQLSDAPSFSPPSPPGPTCRVPSQVSCTWESQNLFNLGDAKMINYTIAWLIFNLFWFFYPLQRVTMHKLMRARLSSTASSGLKEKGFLIQGRESCLKRSEAIQMFGLWPLCNVCPPATQAAQLLPR